MAADSNNVGIADMKIIRQTGTLITYALGSCIGICIYDPIIHLAGMIHIMLPGIPKGGDAKILKYADSGIVEMIKQMEKMGGSRARFTAKIAGGAKMFDVPGESAVGGIGMRNIVASKTVLRTYNIKLTGEDTGLNYARTMLFDAATGKVVVRSYSKPENIL
jgi:chemotaxis protein CheD